MIKVLQVSYSDNDGGAAKATYRLHKYLVERQDKLGVKSLMRVVKKLTQDKTVDGNRPSKETSFWRFIRPSLQIRYFKGFTLGKRTSYSVAWPKTGLVQEINKRKIDIVQLHWLGNDTLSIEEIGKIEYPIVWLFHDMWAFCGAEHYLDSISDVRFVEGYNKYNRPKYEKGKDLNTLTWYRKKKAWKKKMNIVCPSNWLADCVRKSFLMKDWSVSVIPNPLDLYKWKPHDKNLARKLYELPKDAKIILFGAMGGTADPRKGADLLIESLHKLKNIALNLLIFI